MVRADVPGVVGGQLSMVVINRRFATYIGIGVAVMSVVGALLALSNVSTTLEPDDIAVIERMLHVSQGMRPQDYKGEVKLIQEVQTRVLAVAPVGKGIPLDRPREPRDLVRQGHGLCFDRSRTIEKALAYAGFETRHVFIVYKNGESSLLRAMLRAGQPSHAVSEVRTSHGWLLVDSNNVWVAVDKQGEPVGATDLWKRADELRDVLSSYRDPAWTIRGLYSRHGRLYSPYVPVPELSWIDFLTWSLYE